MTYLHESAELDITTEGSRVVLRTEAEGVQVGIAFAPEDACRVAAEIVRKANTAGEVDVVSVYMPRKDWDALVAAAAAGVGALDPTAGSKAAMPLKTVTAVLAYSPSTEG